MRQSGGSSLVSRPFGNTPHIEPMHLFHITRHKTTQDRRQTIFGGQNHGRNKNQDTLMLTNRDGMRVWAFIHKNVMKVPPRKQSALVSCLFVTWARNSEAVCELCFLSGCGAAAARHRQASSIQTRAVLRTLLLKNVHAFLRYTLPLFSQQERMQGGKEHLEDKVKVQPYKRVKYPYKYSPFVRINKPFLNISLTRSSCWCGFLKGGYTLSIFPYLPSFLFPSYIQHRICGRAEGSKMNIPLLDFLIGCSAFLALTCAAQVL